MALRILVAIKQVVDPEVPARDFNINPERREAERGLANLVTDPFCENALEMALQFRDRGGDATIDVLSFGAPTAEESLRKALALKADRATLVINDGNPHPDPLTSAQVLAATIRKLGGFDLILLGREAADWGAGQTGGLLAEELGIPCICFVDRIEKTGDNLRVRRQTDSGREILEARLPLLVTVTNDEHNQPRMAKVRDVMMSYRQPLTKWTLGDIGVEAAAAQAGKSYYEVTQLFIPQTEIRCEICSGDTPAEKAEALARRIADVISGF
jgi:electron transfer flavoprotein beta subunit